MNQDDIKLFSLTCPTCYAILQEGGDRLYQSPSGHIDALQELVAKHDQDIKILLEAVYRGMNERTNILLLLAQQQPGLSSLFEQQAADSKGIQTIMGELLRSYQYNN